MKQAFKPLGIAAAVAAASAGYVGVANSQVVANNALGDLALVPYYTVNGDWITGIHIVNSSDRTQVVKFRFRRATDSVDALDFNIVMSPKDVYAGFLSDNEDGDIRWSADDTTCTVPATTGGVLTMPDIYRENAETGYVEIIAMGSPLTETYPIAVAAEHSGLSGDPALTPASCAAVRSNFFADGVSGTTRGVIDNTSTAQTDLLDSDGDSSTSDIVDNFYEDSGNVLKVSYFIRDNGSGVEFGDNAVHIQDFLTGESAITNQQFGYLSGDLDGFDFPDLDGNAPTAVTPENGKFNILRGGSVLGVASLINEWTANEANGAALDWVVTMPGQYLMFNRIQYLNTLTDDDEECTYGVPTGTFNDGEDPFACDFRDIPVSATILPYNREELTIIPEEGDLVVSPAPPGTVDQLLLEKETNVITYGGNSVLGVSDVDISADLGQPYGWVSLAVTSNAGTTQAVCEWDPAQDAPGTLPIGAPAGQALLQACNSATGNVPMIGFAAWERNVAANPDASYGRIVAHSFVSGS